MGDEKKITWRNRKIRGLKKNGKGLTAAVESLKAQLAAANKRLNWPRCEVCCCELQDGGEGVGYRCPLCDARDQLADTRTALTASAAREAAMRQGCIELTSKWPKVVQEDDRLWLMIEDVGLVLANGYGWTAAREELMRTALASLLGELFRNLPTASADLLAELERLRALEAKPPNPCDDATITGGDQPTFLRLLRELGGQVDASVCDKHGFWSMTLADDLDPMTIPVIRAGIDNGHVEIAAACERRRHK